MMNVADGLKRLKRSGPEMMNGKSGASHHEAASAAPMPGALRAALPMVALAGAAVVVLRWRGSADKPVSEQAQTTANAMVEQLKDAVKKVRPSRRKPRNLVRYYGLGVLIGMIERDTTRKVLITSLKWMQKRA